MTVAEFRKLCEEYAWQQIEGQKRNLSGSVSEEIGKIHT